MGLLQRLFSGASEPKTNSAESERSPDQALSSVRQLTEEIAALKHEIRSLRESLVQPRSGLKTAGVAPTLSAHAPDSQPAEDTSLEGRSRRRRRGGRGRASAAVPDAYPDRGSGETALGFRDEADPHAFRPRTPRPPPEDAPTGPLVDHLKERGVLVYEGQDDLNRNEAFEHLARHLGTHFDLLSPFYEKVKRLVASGRGSKFEIDHFSEQERSAAVQFGTLLHRHGMLKDFYYHRSPKKALRVIPTKDGKTGQFLTGGWLEIFVSMMMSRRLRAHVSPAKCQLLYNVKGALPDGREFEADIMAVVEGRMFWLECKTGNWQDYAARFRGLVNIFGVDRNSSGLLLLRAPDASTRARATDMLDMTMLALNEVDGFICRFLGVEPGSTPLFETADAGTAMLGAGSLDLPERETIEDLRGLPHAAGEGDEADSAEGEGAPLEHVEPAKRLGRVALPGVTAPAGASEPPPAEAEGEGGQGRRRRRRRRRGGAGGAPAHLIEPLPIFGEDRKAVEVAGEADEGVDDAAAETADAEGAAPASGDPGAPGSEPTGERRRRRGRRGGRRRRGGAKPSPFAAGAEGAAPDGEAMPAAESDDARAPLLAPRVADDEEELDDAGADEAAVEEEVLTEATDDSPFAPEPHAPAPAPRSQPAVPVPAAAPQPVKPAEPKPLVTPKVGATGATIAPDWRKMVAGGGQKKTDEAAG